MMGGMRMQHFMVRRYAQNATMLPMSGVGLHYEFPCAAIKRHLARIAALDATAFDAERREIGEFFLGEVQDNIDRQRLWDGAAMPQSEAAKREHRKTLQDEGHLRDSYVYQLVPGGVEIGSNLAYARIHHYGGETGPREHRFVMTARPILGLTDDGKREIGMILIGAVKRTINGLPGASA